MTRFKELRRIQDAIKHKNKNEILWGISFYEDRIRMAKMKHHKKEYLKWLKKLEGALEECD